MQFKKKTQLHLDARESNQKSTSFYGASSRKTCRQIWQSVQTLTTGAKVSIGARKIKASKPSSASVSHPFTMKRDKRWSLRANQHETLNDRRFRHARNYPTMSCLNASSRELANKTANKTAYTISCVNRATAATFCFVNYFSSVIIIEKMSVARIKFCIFVIWY